MIDPSRLKQEQDAWGEFEVCFFAPAGRGDRTVVGVYVLRGGVSVSRHATFAEAEAALARLYRGQP